MSPDDHLLVCTARGKPQKGLGPLRLRVQDFGLTVVDGDNMYAYSKDICIFIYIYTHIHIYIYIYILANIQCVELRLGSRASDMRALVVLVPIKFPTGAPVRGLKGSFKGSLSVPFGIPLAVP